MKKIIEVDLVNEENIFEKYNKELASKELINYMINEVDPFNKKETINVIFNNLTKLKEDEYIPTIKKTLKIEYEKCVKEIDHNNIYQFIYFLIGIILLLISTLFNFSFVFEEIFIIGAWVLIWETIEIQVFSDTKIKKRKLALTKLMKSQMKEIDD